MRGLDTPPGGLVFFTPPSRRQRIARKRWIMAALIAGLVLAGAVVGRLSGAGDAATPIKAPAYQL